VFLIVRVAGGKGEVVLRGLFFFQHPMGYKKKTN